ncbi:MAG: cobalamin B12-binding domain-containing protein [Actinobacteria bacterium]|nr:cobalamin B12-binding domain-containing protein [Actinomycetota bacterium]
MRTSALTVAAVAVERLLRIRASRSGGLCDDSTNTSGRSVRNDPARGARALSRPIRVVVAKPGLDGHDRGAKIVARALRDAGMEVIYTGLHQTPEQIAATVIQEDADALGLSILSGAHMTLVPRIIDLLRAEDAGYVPILVGGTIPADDAAELKRLGIHDVYGPGASVDAMIDAIHALCEQKERTNG